jgi:hypothetical protein
MAFFYNIERYMISTRSEVNITQNNVHKMNKIEHIIINMIISSLVLIY